MLDADAIIVGSGPAGAAAAQGLIEGGARVLVLEVGRRPARDRFAMMERALLGEIPWKSPAYPYEMNGDDIELNEFAIRVMGGSSLAWGAITPRFHANDFRMRSRYGVAVDWPLGYEELEPYYCRAERFLGVSGAADNPFASPRSQPFPMPSFPMNDSDELVKAACSGLGISLHSVPVARNSVTYEGRSACAYYGTCRACPIGAMYSSDRTIVRLERNPRFRLITEAEALRIEVDGERRARRVVYRDADGREQVAQAQRIILAVQAVETVRILLNSACGPFPHGLGNDTGMLGRYFCEHPKFYVTGRVKERLHPHRQGFETAATCQFHDHPERDRYAGGRLLVRENAGPSVPQIAIQSGKWGRALKQEIRELFGHNVTLGAFLEQLPHERNRIRLSDHLVAESGLPASRVDFRLVGDYEREGYRRMKAIMVAILEALGAQEIETIMEPSNSGHYMGGHRMGDDPESSVTNSHLEVHGIEDLYLAGSGVFPTSGVSNPTLTTVALVLRMVDHLLQKGVAHDRG